MTIKTEGTYIHDIVKWEINPEYSREVVTIASGGGVLKKGTVLEINGTSGKYEALSYTAGEGENPASVGEAAAILLEDIDATTSAVSAVVLVRLAVVYEGALILPTAIDATSKAEVLAALVASGIVLRKGV